MTQAEAGELDIDDRVLVRVSGEGWVPGLVVNANYSYGRRQETRIDVVALDGREFSNVQPRFIKRGRPMDQKQDWSPREI